MSSRASQIGFSQRVRLEWLQQAANLVLAGSGKATVHDALDELLDEKVSVQGRAQRSNREKIITILLKIWLTSPSDLECLRLRGLELLRRLPQKDHIAVHWGMAMAVYPFWGSVGTQVGRLLKLQGSAAATHVQRRVREQYGERETVSRAARRVLRSYLDWGVLRDTEVKGVYEADANVRIDDRELTGWLVEASLHARPNGAGSARELLQSPCLFPFVLQPLQPEALVAVSPGLDLLRHSVSEDLVMLLR